MRKRMILVGVLVVLAVAYGVNAHADGAAAGQTTAWQGFWDSVGGFLYNALPWNWHNWAGK